VPILQQKPRYYFLAGGQHQQQLLAGCDGEWAAAAAEERSPAGALVTDNDRCYARRPSAVSATDSPRARADDERTENWTQHP